MAATTAVSDKQRIAEAFRVGVPPTFDILPSYNIAPQTFQPVIRLSRETGQRELAQMRGGLIPYWAKDAKIGFSTINAKAETVSTAPAFREALKRRRCLAGNVRNDTPELCRPINEQLSPIV